MKRAKGTFFMRASILLFAGVFGLLVYGSVGFLLQDLEEVARPDWSDFEESRSDPSYQTRREALEEELAHLQHRRDLIERQRGFIKDATGSLNALATHLLSADQKETSLLSSDQFARLRDALDQVIRIQDEFNETAREYLKVTEEEFTVERAIAGLNQQMEQESRSLRNDFEASLQTYRNRTTLAKLALLIPLLLGSTALLLRKRKSMYRLIFLSTALAIYARAGGVLHEAFPSRYFKYVLIGVLLALVGWGFTWLIRRLVRPSVDVLLKQYRQAYERFFCPVCEYPIRTGPRKFLYWTRRSVHKTPLPPPVSDTHANDEVYTCPSCGTGLFEPCPECGGIRHSLLPTCRHCGARHEIQGDAY